MTVAVSKISRCIVTGVMLGLVWVALALEPGTCEPRYERRTFTDAVPALIQALQDYHPDVRQQAAWALGQIGPAAKEAIPALTQTLAAPGIRDVVGEALRKIKGQ